ncbi:prenyltransferase/squalene oxidase repeat-containing protein [Streptomyces sp. NPDC046821]|uniref:prenyltransferase/squalene oxidase repeat-containing protein n=1 Tax=Streptomyces sp. NPDC046821 TaxID=3154702 RepID=UPI0033E4A4C8
MNIRRTAALVGATVVIGAACAPAAVADSASPSPKVVVPSGLYGTSDPTYDGVWRQSLALLAQDTMGVKPASKAVDWLTGQQCANGGFAAFRSDAGKACDAKTPLDSNSTAVAVQALAALGGHDAEIGKAVKWLKSVEAKGGGWGYMPGGAADANSTSVVIGALTAAGEKVTDAQAALVKLSIPCTKGDKDSGAFAYQPDKKGKLAANADATAAGVLGGLGKGLAPVAGKSAGAPTCKAGTPDAAQAAENGAAYLTGELAKDHHLMSAMPGAEAQPDYGNTADAVTALAAAGHHDEAAGALTWLEKNSAKWAEQSGPAAYAQLILASHAAGADPRDFGGTDLVKALNATGPAPVTKADAQAAKKDEKRSGGLSVWYIVAVAAVAGIGIGFLFSGRKKQQL